MILLGGASCPPSDSAAPGSNSRHTPPSVSVYCHTICCVSLNPCAALQAFMYNWCTALFVHWRSLHNNEIKENRGNKWANRKPTGRPFTSVWVPTSQAHAILGPMPKPCRRQQVSGVSPVAGDRQTWTKVVVQDRFPSKCIALVVLTKVSCLVMASHFVSWSPLPYDSRRDTWNRVMSLVQALDTRAAPVSLMY